MDHLLPLVSLHDDQGRPLVLAAANLLAGVSEGAHLVSEGNKRLEVKLLRNFHRRSSNGDME